jgi:hypothetical protein
MIPFLPPEDVAWLVHRDSYPELRDSSRAKAYPLAAEYRRFWPGSFGAILAKLPTAGRLISCARVRYALYTSGRSWRSSRPPA